MLTSVCRLEFPPHFELRRLARGHPFELRMGVRGLPFVPSGCLMVAGPVGRPS